MPFCIKLIILVQIHICGYIFLHPSPQGFQTLINQAKCLHLNNVYLQIIWKYDRLHFLHRLKRINVTILQIMDHNDWLTSYGSSHNILKYFIFICGLYPFFHLDKNQITLSSHHNLQAVWRISYNVSAMSHFNCILTMSHWFYQFPISFTMSHHVLRILTLNSDNFSLTSNKF